MHCGSRLKLKKFAPFTSSPCAWSSVRSLHLDSPFYFLLYLPPLFLFLKYLKSVVNLHNSANESMDSTDEFSLSTFLKCRRNFSFDDAACRDSLCILSSHQKKFQALRHARRRQKRPMPSNLHVVTVQLRLQPREFFVTSKVFLERLSGKTSTNSAGYRADDNPFFTGTCVSGSTPETLSRHFSSASARSG